MEHYTRRLFIALMNLRTLYLLIDLFFRGSFLQGLFDSTNGDSQDGKEIPVCERERAYSTVDIMKINAIDLINECSLCDSY